MKQLQILVAVLFFFYVIISSLTNIYYMYIFNVFRIFVYHFQYQISYIYPKTGFIFLKVVLVGQFLNSERKGSTSHNHKSDYEYSFQHLTNCFQNSASLMSYIFFVRAIFFIILKDVQHLNLISLSHICKISNKYLFIYNIKGVTMDHFFL